MRQCLLGLRHDAVIRRNDQDDDVRHMGTSCAHGGEGGMTGSVDKSDRLAVVKDTVGSDVLGDAARFTRDDLRLAQGIEQGGLPMVNMSHERDDRGAEFELLLLHLFNDLRGRLDDDFFNLVNACAFFTLLALQLESMLFTDFLGHFDVNGLVRTREDLEGDQIGNDFERLEAHLFRQIFDDDRGLQVNDLLPMFTDFEFRLHDHRRGGVNDGGDDLRGRVFFEQGDRGQRGLRCICLRPRTPLLRLVIVLKQIQRCRLLLIDSRLGLHIFLGGRGWFLDFDRLRAQRGQDRSLSAFSSYLGLNILDQREHLAFDLFSGFEAFGWRFHLSRLYSGWFLRFGGCGLAGHEKGESDEQSGWLAWRNG